MSFQNNSLAKVDILKTWMLKCVILISVLVVYGGNSTRCQKLITYKSFVLNMCVQVCVCKNTLSLNIYNFCNAVISIEIDFLTMFQVSRFSFQLKITMLSQEITVNISHLKVLNPFITLLFSSCEPTQIHIILSHS